MSKRNLRDSQIHALNYISNYAKYKKETAVKDINSILKMSNIDTDLFESVISKIKKNARISIHFHPDRLTNDLKSVSESLLESGFYKNQFETLISNGSVSAYSGGERDLWEQKLFNGTYKSEEDNINRPKYGSLNLMLHGDGSSPRFGSCYFLLKPEISKYATYTYMDSHQDPDEKGTYEEFDYIISALLTEIFNRDYALGEKNLTVTKFINHILKNIDKPFEETFNKNPSRNLNHYIEAQIHTDISLKDDVEILVIDPAFINTNTGKVLEEVCNKYDIKMYFHNGFKLSVNEVPSDFRGASMPSLAQRISKNNMIDINLIGNASIDLKLNPNNWSDRGSYQEVLQELKLLWHVLVKFGV